MKKFKEINDKNDPKMPLSLKNYILLLAGLIVIILGFVLMAGGGSDSPDEFNYAMFSWRRITLAPILKKSAKSDKQKLTTAFASPSLFLSVFRDSLRMGRKNTAVKIMERRQKRTVLVTQCHFIPFCARLKKHRLMLHEAVSFCSSFRIFRYFLSIKNVNTMDGIASASKMIQSKPVPIFAAVCTAIRSNNSHGTPSISHDAPSKRT